MDLDCISIPPQRPALGVADIGRTTFVELAKRKGKTGIFFPDIGFFWKQRRFLKAMT